MAELRQGTLGGPKGPKGGHPEEARVKVRTWLFDLPTYTDVDPLLSSPCRPLDRPGWWVVKGVRFEGAVAEVDLQEGWMPSFASHNLDSSKCGDRQLICCILVHIRQLLE